MTGADELAGVVLAAGLGTRLWPLTAERPKALCPVGNVALLDWALARLDDAGVGALGVNAHHRPDDIVAHLGASSRWGGRVNVSVESAAPLGTAGALRAMSGWLDGRSALVVNADAWTTAAVSDLLASWDGGSPAILVANGGFSPTACVAAAVIPAPEIARLPDGPSGLWEQVWAPHQAAGTLQVVSADAVFVDCGTPERYLHANLAASGGVSVVGEGAQVSGTVQRCVVWPGAVVAAGEHLVDAVRTTAGRTVMVRRYSG
jgi:NDP-sugar pyrophosphorylase family protein